MWRTSVVSRDSPLCIQPTFSFVSPADLVSIDTVGQPIQEGALTRRAPVGAQSARRVTPPGVLYGCETKGVAGRGICIVMKTKGGKFGGEWRVTSGERRQMRSFRCNIATGLGKKRPPSGGKLYVADSTRARSGGIPHPGCPVVAFGMPHPTPRHFGKRGWICLIAKELTFLGTTKSLQQYERSRVTAGVARAVGEGCSR